MRQIESCPGAATRWTSDARSLVQGALRIQRCVFRVDETHEREERCQGEQDCDVLDAVHASKLRSLAQFFRLLAEDDAAALRIDDDFRVLTFDQIGHHFNLTELQNLVG